jgi:hypothetical protein
MPPEETTPAPSSPGPTSTPEPAAPETTATPEPSTGSPSDAFAGFDFSNMDFADESGETVVIDKTKPETGQPAPAPAQAKPEAPSAPAAPAPTAAPQPTAAQPTVPTPAPTPQAPPSPAAPETDPYLEAWKQHAQQLDGELQKYYAIDDATAEAILENPKEVLPKIFSKLHMAVLQNTYKAVLDRLPPLMQNTAQAVRQHAASEEKFYRAWPVFNRDDPTHSQTLLQYAQLFRSQNPGASEADFTKFVGAAAAAHLGLKMPIGKGNGKGKPIPYAPGAASAPSSGSGSPAPTQFEDMFSAVLLQE